MSTSGQKTDAVPATSSTTTPLRRAMEDGFVKEPAVVTRKNFNAAGIAPAELERMKLEDGIRLHESTKVELETYARETGQPRREALRPRHRAGHHARRRSCWSSSRAMRSSTVATRTRSSRSIPAAPASRRTRRSSACSRSSTPTSRPRSSSTSTCSRRAGTSRTSTPSSRSAPPTRRSSSSRPSAAACVCPTASAPACRRSIASASSPRPLPGDRRRGEPQRLHHPDGEDRPHG